MTIYLYQLIGLVIVLIQYSSLKVFFKVPGDILMDWIILVYGFTQQKVLLGHMMNTNLNFSAKRNRLILFILQRMKSNLTNQVS